MTPAEADTHVTGREGGRARTRVMRVSEQAERLGLALVHGARRRTRLHLVMQEAMNVTNNLRHDLRKLPRGTLRAGVRRAMYGCMDVLA